MSRASALLIAALQRRLSWDTLRYVMISTTKLMGMLMWITIAAVFFSCTVDLNATFPAKAARQLGLTQVPLLCSAEIDVPGALARCIRVTLLVNSELYAACPELIAAFRDCGAEIASHGRTNSEHQAELAEPDPAAARSYLD